MIVSPVILLTLFIKEGQKIDAKILKFDAMLNNSVK
jgi:hypothetical protein